MSRGGYRPGAGRKQSSGAYKESTVVRRIPESLAPILDGYLERWRAALTNSMREESLSSPFSRQASLSLPYFSSRVSAGFPSHSDSHQEKLDLEDYLIRSAKDTFVLQVTGDSMINAGIMEGDLLIVDRGLEVKSGAVVVAAINGDTTVKTLEIKNNKVYLKPENPNYPIIEVADEMNFVIFGKVTSVIHKIGKG